MGQDASSLSSLERDIGYWFKNKEILKEALSHDSLRNKDLHMRDYQRHEFLGDAVIHFVITNYLFSKHPSWAEGNLSIGRNSLVNQQTQREIAEKLGLQKFVQMDSGVLKGGFKRIDKFLEALIGAVFMDAGGELGEGYREARKVIYKLWELQEPPQSGCIVA